MLSKRAAIILGGVIASPLLLLLIQIVLAEDPPPTAFHQFAGKVTVGGVSAADDLEISVKAFDVGQNELVPIPLTQASVDDQGRHLTKNGTYGDPGISRVFQVRADQNPFDGVRDGAFQGEALFFFVGTSTGGLAYEGKVGQSSVSFKSGFTEVDISVVAVAITAPTLAGC